MKIIKRVVVVYKVDSEYLTLLHRATSYNKINVSRFSSSSSSSSSSFSSSSSCPSSSPFSRSLGSVYSHVNFFVLLPSQPLLNLLDVFS